LQKNLIKKKNFRIVSTNLQTIQSLKSVRPIVATTVYDSVMAELADQACIDLLLVGDSVGTTLLGFETTVNVTLEMMLHHTSAVSRAEPKALIVSDLPYGYSHDNFEHIFDACRKLIQAGAGAVKIEGGSSIAPTIKRLVDSGIPILGHIGLLPQQIKNLGKYRKFGKKETEAQTLIQDANALEDAGCFALIGEMIEDTVAKEISQLLKVPLIGIGSGVHCDGQILVSNDLLGLSTKPVPSFVHSFSHLSENVIQSFQEYKNAVIERKYPNE
jgi:3-methyl-2-oxobutanoate hydroxymethyltransferase